MSFIGPYTNSFLRSLKKEFRKESTQQKIMDSTVRPLLNSIISKNKILISIIIFIVVFILSILVFNSYQLSKLNNKILSIQEIVSKKLIDDL